MLVQSQIKNILCNLLIVFVSLILWSCDKDDDTVQDTQQPTITLVSPTQDQLNAGFTVGSTVTVTGTVTDNELLDRVGLTFSTAAGIPLVNEEWADINEQTLSINESVVIPAVTPAGQYALTISATDISNNEASVTYNFEIRN